MSAIDNYHDNNSKNHINHNTNNKNNNSHCLSTSTGTLPRKKSVKQLIQNYDNLSNTTTTFFHKLTTYNNNNHHSLHCHDFKENHHHHNSVSPQHQECHKTPSSHTFQVNHVSNHNNHNGHNHLVKKNSTKSLHHQQNTRPLDLPSCILPQMLYLGDCFQANNEIALKHLRITHVINVTNSIDNNFPSTLQYLRIPIHDADHEDIKQYFDTCYNFIEKAFNDENGRVLVHCKAGVSRSAAIVISYLMKKMNISFYSAYQMVKGRRPMVLPNEGFFKQLLEYEMELKGKLVSEITDYNQLLDSPEFF
ncbi:hypothetical protein ABK040_007803 [Willaertia magna]